MRNRTIYGAMLAASWIGAALSASGQDRPPTLLRSIPMPPSSYQAPRHVSRYSAVAVDFSLLANARVDDVIELELFPDAVFDGIVDRVEHRGETRYTVAGRLDGIDQGTFAIVVQEDVAVALIDAGTLGQRFKLRYLGGGVHLITELDPSEFGRCATVDDGVGQQNAGKSDEGLGNSEAVQPDEGGGDDGSADPAACSEPIATFDLLIYYTTIAKNAAGGKNAIEAECQLAIEGMNTGYSNSSISAIGRLVQTGEVSYNESGDFETHRDRLQDAGDGIMDNIPPARDTYSADLVSLWVDDDDGGDICGIAFCTPDSDYAYQVSNWDCAVSNYTFHHEHGHLQGCAHNRADAGSGCNWYGYSYGWRFFGNSGNGWRTVMAYNNDAKDYTRINWFSNPSINYDGKPTGVSNSEDNARTIRNRRRTVEDWRFSKYDVWVDFGSGGLPFGSFEDPYTTVALGVARCATGGLVRPTLHIKTGTTAETLTINKNIVINTCGGTAIIGKH